MTREEQLWYCKKCLNREFDPKQGIICAITGQKATFEIECPDFKVDESVKEIPLNDEEGIPTAEVKQKLSPEIFEKLKMEQHLLAGMLAGLIVGLIGAILWGMITVATNFQIGYMALAIGAGVGFAIRKFGNGVEAIFGFWGAGISLFSVLLGNFLSIIGWVANTEDLGYLETLILFDYSYLPEVMSDTFSFMDLIFYGIAIYEGYWFSFRKITAKNMHEFQTGKS
ncbi:MAG: hypothetical protein P8100_08405 [bacterium]|jgi:hypothetical protein